MIRSASRRGLLLSAGIAVGSVWLGLSLAYAAPKLPPSFAILAVTTATYLAAGLWHRLAVPARPGRPTRRTHEPVA